MEKPANPEDGLKLDHRGQCTHFDHMKRKTVSLDVDAYRLIKRRQAPHESISQTIRRVFEEEKDPADYLDELFQEYGGKGILTENGRAQIRRRQQRPVKSSRPVRAEGADDHAA